MRPVPLAIAAATCLALSGCGGGSGSSYDSAAAVAKAAGCSSFKSQDPEAFADDAGTCRYNGHPTYVQWFKSGDSLDSWWGVARVSGAPLLRGQNWAVECGGKADCDALRGTMGGTQSG